MWIEEESFESSAEDVEGSSSIFSIAGALASEASFLSSASLAPTLFFLCAVGSQFSM